MRLLCCYQDTFTWLIYSKWDKLDGDDILTVPLVQIGAPNWTVIKILQPATTMRATDTKQMWAGSEFRAGISTFWSGRYYAFFTPTWSAITEFRQTYQSWLENIDFDEPFRYCVELEKKKVLKHVFIKKWKHIVSDFFVSLLNCIMHEKRLKV